VSNCSTWYKPTNENQRKEGQWVEPSVYQSSFVGGEAGTFLYRLWSQFETNRELRVHFMARVMSEGLFPLPDEEVSDIVRLHQLPPGVQMRADRMKAFYRARALYKAYRLMLRGEVALVTSPSQLAMAISLMSDFNRPGIRMEGVEPLFQPLDRVIELVERAYYLQGLIILLDHANGLSLESPFHQSEVLNLPKMADLVWGEICVLNQGVAMANLKVTEAELQLAQMDLHDAALDFPWFYEQLTGQLLE
jgi:hypothetical protein